jgi:hypothetical protein
MTDIADTTWKETATARAKTGVCEGNCLEKHGGHFGAVQPAYVKNWGWFAYCTKAIEEDRSRGLIVNVEDQ